MNCTIVGTKINVAKYVVKEYVGVLRHHVSYDEMKFRALVFFFRVLQRDHIALLFNHGTSFQLRVNVHT